MSPVDPTLEEVISRVCDGIASDEETKYLARLLREKPGALDAYIHQVDLHTALAVNDWNAEKKTLCPPDLLPESQRDSLVSSRIWRSAAAVLLVFGAIASWFLAPSKEPSRRAIASLCAATSAQWSDPELEVQLRRGELPRGSLRLIKGLAEFKFSDGATVILEGPAEFKPLTARRLFVTSGKVFCRCPNERSRITVITPETEVVDLGTEFTVEIRPDRKTRVGVLKGEVSLPKQAQPLRITAGQSVEITSLTDVHPVPLQLKSFSPLVFADAAKLNALKEAKNELVNADFEGELGDLRLAQNGWKGTQGHVAAVEGLGRNHTRGLCIRALGNKNYPLARQSVDARAFAGRLVIASAWAMDAPDSPMNELQGVILKLAFFDESGHEFGFAERYYPRGSGMADHFQEAQIAAVIPQQTARVEFQVLLRARGFDSGAVIFDDVSLVVPQASALESLAP